MKIKSLILLSFLLALYSSKSNANDYLLDSTLAFNGSIKTILTYNGVNYIGGSFTKISYITGFGSMVNNPTGEYDINFPKINGRVNVAIPDGNGGYYIGGEFTKVGEFNRQRIAHINELGEVTAFAPSVNVGSYPYVYDMVLYNNKLYVSGSFNGINGVVRNYLACLDLNGNVTSWNPSSNDEVFTINAFDNVIYFGGNFTKAGNQERYFVAAADLNGNVTSWNPEANNNVRDIEINNSKIYLGGSFTRVKGVNCSRFCAINPNNEIESLFPIFNNTVEAIRVINNRIYVGGRFTKVNNTNRNYLAAIDYNGLLLAWNPQPNATVFGLEANENGVTIAGSFSKVTGQNRSSFARIDHNGVLSNWNPNANGTGYAIGLGNTNTFIGGLFNGLGGYDRTYLAAIDTLGNVLPWNPSPNSEVYSIFAHDTIVYISGTFTKVANTSISKFAALNYSTGVPLSWRPVFNGSVYSLINFDDRIVVAGAFTKINNLSRNYMAAFDSDGQLMDFAPDINSAIFAMDHDKGKLYLGGFFTEVNGISRNRIACIDTSGSLTNFNPDVDNAILALKFFKDKIYIGGWFDFVSGQSRTKFACINKNGYLTSFAPNPNNAVWSIMTFSVPFDVIYIGGDFTSIFGQSLSNLAAIDANGGLVPWYPNPDKSVFALSSSGSQVYAGGLFLSFENTLSPNFAILSTYSLNPGKPTLISPVNNSLKIPVLSRFDWNATEYTSNYRIQFSTNIQFNAIVYDTIVDINYLQFAESKLLYNTKMYWRVRSINLQGISQWSDTWSFTTRVAPPPAPILVSPSDASIGIGLSDIFKWNLSTTAESYQIQFSSDEFFNSIILNDSSVADTQRAIFDLAVEPLQSYYWRTRAINESGPGMWSQEWNFTTAEFFAQNINLKVGWNLISSNLIPLNDTVSVIFHNIDDKILIVKNGGGAVYIPQYQINTIGKWKDKDSYNVYCTSASTLTILGYRLNPDIVNYNLVTGWNLISYIRSSDMGVEVALKSLTDDNKLLIAKDGNGNVFIPDYGINTIGNMKTGLGYNLYIKSPITFTYPAND